MKEMNYVKQELLNTVKTEIMIVFFCCLCRLMMNQYHMGSFFCLVLLTTVNFILCFTYLFKGWEKSKRGSLRE